MTDNAKWLIKKNIEKIEERLLHAGTILLAGEQGETLEFQPVALIYEVDWALGSKILDLLDQRCPSDGPDPVRLLPRLVPVLWRFGWGV